MEEDHPIEFVALQHGPAPPHRRVRFIVALPGPLDGGLAVPLALPVVDDALDVAELERNPLPLLELDERLTSSFR
jgi:hypothetical protein